MRPGDEHHRQAGIASPEVTHRFVARQARIDREETRINRYADLLRKQFTQMDTQVAGWNAQANYLANAL